MGSNSISNTSSLKLPSYHPSLQMGSTAGPVTGNLSFTLWIIDYCNFPHYSMGSSSVSITWLRTLLTNCHNLNIVLEEQICFVSSQSFHLQWISPALTCLSQLHGCDCDGRANLLCQLPIFTFAMNLTSTNLSFPASQLWLWWRSKSAFSPPNLCICNESHQH